MKLAEYKTQPIEEFSNNPLIEALPEYLVSKKDRSLCFIQRNPISKEEKRLDPGLRIGKLANLSKIFVPTNWGISLSTSIDLLIREGYRRRNPLDQDGIRKAYSVEVSGLNDLPDLRDPVGCFFLVGATGMGKTTTLARYLSSYPKIIQHVNYQGIPLNIFQIVYIHVDVPPDGSIRSFCMNVLQEIDKDLGTHYVEQNKRLTIAGLSNLLAKLCAMHYIGLIIIDESQNLLHGHYGKERLAEFLNNLSNKIGCPFCIVGTPDSSSLLKGTFHLCRRFERKGSKIIHPYSPDSPDWKTFVSILWQDGLYLKDENELTEEIFKALHHYSFGIPAILKDLLYEIQRVILENEPEEEKITPELIQQVADQHFPNIQNNIQAVRDHNIARIMQMGDWSVQSESQSLQENYQQRKIRKDGNKEHELEDTIYFLLTEMGYLELFSSTQLKDQARLIALEVGPETQRFEYASFIVSFMDKLIKKESAVVTDPLPRPDLTESIADVEHLF